MACTKALEVISFVDEELGFNTQNSELSMTKKVFPCVFLVIDDFLLINNIFIRLTFNISGLFVCKR